MSLSTTNWDRFLLTCASVSVATNASGMSPLASIRLTRSVEESVISSTHSICMPVSASAFWAASFSLKLSLRSSTWRPIAILKVTGSVVSGSAIAAEHSVVSSMTQMSRLTSFFMWCVHPFKYSSRGSPR